MGSSDGRRGGGRMHTRIVHKGNDPASLGGMVNPPVYHGSTVVFPTLAALEQSRIDHELKDRVVYGRLGSRSTFALENAVADLEGGFGALSVSSGLAAVTTTILAFAGAGDHVLVADTVYGPTRKFCDAFLTRMGVTVEYYDPIIGAGIASRFRGNTSLVFMESPGSITFEVQDAPAIAAAARSRGIITALDNSWATPLYFRPIEHGVNISVIAATKYIVGHSDATLGLAVCDTEENFYRVKQSRDLVGQSLAPDDVYLGLRGLRTLGVRVEKHRQQALELAHYLSGRQEVLAVFHPAFPDCPGHEVWLRDFSGSTGLFSVLLKPASHDSLRAMLDGMRFFSMGFSWGGYESLIVPQYPQSSRSACPWNREGQIIRLHAGLEDIQDLLEDLEAALERYLA